MNARDTTPLPTDDVGDDDTPAVPLNAGALAASILALLQADPSRYRSFGPYWPLIKHLLKQSYSQDNMFLLGQAIDRDAAARMPSHTSIAEALAAAVEFYRSHQAYGMGSNQFVDDNGDEWVLADADAGGL